MSGGAVVAIVVALFFVVGITVGIVTVVALSAVRRERGGVPRPVKARSSQDLLAGLAGLDDDIDEQDPRVSGVPGHWTDSTKKGANEARDNRLWWQDDKESNPLG